MKKIWNAASFMFIVNGLAVVLFVCWLIASGRLDMDRVYAIREVLAQTIAQEAFEAERAAEAEAAVDREAAERARRENPQPPSIVQIGYAEQMQQMQRDRARRASDDLARLRRELELERAELDRERVAFESERSAWEEHRSTLAGRANDVQFRQVVSMLEGLPSKQAKDILVQSIAAGHLDLAASYLNAMKPFTSTKILREFKTDVEKEMATELLNRLRTLGEPPSGAESMTNADASPTTG